MFSTYLVCEGSAPVPPEKNIYKNFKALVFLISIRKSDLERNCLVLYHWMSFPSRVQQIA